MIDLIRKTDLLERGWTQTMIRKFCPEPHAVVSGIRNAWSHFYALEEIKQIEQTTNWQADAAKLAERRAARNNRSQVQELARALIEEVQLTRERAKVAGHVFDLPTALTRGELIALCKVPPAARDPDRVCIQTVTFRCQSQIDKCAYRNGVRQSVVLERFRFCVGNQYPWLANRMNL